jgi:membrane fusion protein, multidrug efflux system
MTRMAALWGGAPLLVAVVVAGCGGGSEARAEGSDTAQAYVRTVNVEVVTVGGGAFTDYLRLVATAEAERDVTVSAEEGGVVTRLFVQKGTRVAAGQPLARVDDRVLSAQLEQARAQARLAREQYERQRRLWQDEQIGSEMAYIQAMYQAEMAEASAKVLAERVSRTVVRAPIAGLVEERFVQVGAMVAPGSPVVRIVDADTVKIAGGVPERFAADVARGAEARVTFDVLGGREFAGRASFVGAAVNPRDRTMPLEIEVANPGGVIKPGMVAEVRLTRRAYDAAITVPRDAVLRTEAGYVVMVVEEQDGRLYAAQRVVGVGPSAAGSVVIESGLEPGDRVVVVGQQQVAAGDLVQIVGGGGVR